MVLSVLVVFLLLREDSSCDLGRDSLLVMLTGIMPLLVVDKAFDLR